MDFIGCLFLIFVLVNSISALPKPDHDDLCDPDYPEYCDYEYEEDTKECSAFSDKRKYPQKELRFR